MRGNKAGPNRLKLASSVCIGLSLAAGGAARAEEVEFATGLVQVDRAVYAKLPSVRRHRGFYKPVVDLSDRFPKPGYQGSQGTCAAFSTTYAARSFLRAGQLGHQPQATSEVPSPEYVYTRIRGESSDCRVGVSLLQALEILKSEGVVTLSDFPYDRDHCLHPPPEALKSKAGVLRIGGWRAIQRKTPNDWTTPIVLDDVKAQLSAGLPVVFSFPVSDAFEHFKGDVFKGEAGTDWHSMALVGYDESKQAFHVMNSWGGSWNDHGYVWIDYATFEKNAGEAYVLEPGEVDQPAMPRVELAALSSPSKPASSSAVAPAANAPAVVAPVPVALKPPPLAAPKPTPDVDPQIAAAIRATDCAALRLELSGGRRVITGFGGLEPALVKTKAAVAALDPRAEWRVANHPWPQCEAELTLAQVNDPARVKLSLNDGAGRALAGEPIALTKGQEFAVDVETKSDKPFVHVVYIQADGTAVELYRGAPKADASGRRRAVVGADGPRGVRFRVDSPFGYESLIAVASAEPLFGTELKSQVTEREFLTLLRAKLVNAAKAGRAVSASLVLMRSTEGPARQTASLGR